MAIPPGRSIRTSTATLGMSSGAGGRIGASTRRPPRWGLRSLGFLALTVLALVVASLQGHHTLGTGISAVLGLGGAAVCSVRGVRAVLALEWARRPGP